MQAGGANWYTWPVAGLLLILVVNVPELAVGEAEELFNVR